MRALDLDVLGVDKDGETLAYVRAGDRPVNEQDMI